MCESCRNGGPELAGIWWRVSTEGQKEISPDTQTNEALALATAEGYQVPANYIIGTDWHSLSVWESPAMEGLKQLIRSQSIHAIFMYHPDRGPSKPAHRLLFRAMCEEYGVEVRCRAGQIPSGEMGEVMEFLDAWGKEKSVHRAAKGSKDGHRDRAMIKKLPIGGHAPFGCQFRYELKNDIKTPVALEPKFPGYHVVSTIWRRFLDGGTVNGLCKQLVKEGVPAPKGGKAWNVSTMSQILRNPVYGGRYYAQRHEAKEPVTRPNPDKTYGKSSVRRKPMEEWYWLEDFPIESPVVTWEEFEAVQARLALNKRYSRGHSKRPYLLRGIIYCEQDNRRLAAQSVQGGDYYYYKCPRQTLVKHGTTPCDCPTLPGPETEATVWENVVAFLGDPRTFMTEMDRRRGENASGEEVIESDIKILEGKLTQVDQMETELVGLKLRGEVSEVAFHRSSALLRAERVHYEDEIRRQRITLATLAKSTKAFNTLADLRERIADRLDAATPEDKAWVLQTLGVRVVVAQGGLDISVGVPDYLIPSGSYDSTSQILTAAPRA